MRYEPVPDRVKLVICDTGVRHSLAAGEYNLRRAQCEAGVAGLAKILPDVRSLRDVTLTQLSEYGSILEAVIYRRCRHVITENVRVLDAAKALERADLAEFGRLMIESHRSLRDDYEVSCEELDIMVELALEAAREGPGVYGARMTGGGFGGCTINLVESEYADEFARTISRNYETKTGRTGSVYVCSAAGGAQEEQF
jgi:galactokinase